MKRLRRLTQLSLISTSFFGLIHFPVLADTATLQNGDQDAVVSGDNNQVTQIINQTIINHPGRGSLNRSDNNKKDRTQHSTESEFENRGNRYGVGRNNNKK
jgi:hypothetical protein